MKIKHVVSVVAVIVFFTLAALKFFQPHVPEPQPEASFAARRSQTPDLLAPRLPLAPRQVETETNVLAFTNAFTRWSKGERPELTVEQVEAYLHQNHRNAVSLLAAARVSGDKSYLREAMEKFPNDPHVAFDAYFRSDPYDSTQPASEERRKWLDSFKQSDPDNALPNYLAARDDFKAGKTDIALQELQAASNKSLFQDYLLDSLQSTEEAYRAAGYSEAEAKTIASSNLLLPHLSDAKQLAQNLVDLANQYRQSGDSASAQAILQMGIGLGGRFNGPGEFPLINTLVGIAIERNLLAAMDPNSPFFDTGLTVQQQLDALNQRRVSLKPIAAQHDALLPQMSDADLVSFYDRLRLFGEPAAMNWAVNKYAPQ
jgi:hypothetical protein